MFLLGLRDRGGVSVAACLVAAWVFSLLLVQQANTITSLVIVLWSLLVTIYAARVLLKSRDTLGFNSRYSEEHAFPSTRMTERLTFGLHAILLLFCYVPATTMLIMKLPNLTEAETRMVTGIAFLVGNLGVAGLALQGLRKLHARQ